MRKLAREAIGRLRVRTLACSRDRIREGVATTTSGLSDMIILHEFEV